MLIGKIYEFEIMEETNDGHILKPLIEGEEDARVFLPYLKTDFARSKALKVGEKIEAFLQQIIEDEFIASLKIPVAQVDEFAVLQVKDTQGFGAFLDWGLEKDLYVSAKKQKTPMRRGERHLVRICYDSQSGKLYGTSKFGSLLETLDIHYTENEKVHITPVEEHELGYRCIVDEKFIGMLYHSEIFQDIELEKTLEGYVKKVRQDGLIDLALQIQGFKNLDESQTKILEYLEENGGQSHLHDKSSPEEIKKHLSMSKMSFKKAVGMLYKARKIEILKGEGIKLL